MAGATLLPNALILYIETMGWGADPPRFNLRALLWRSTRWWVQLLPAAAHLGI